jgi:hypothetical protein
MLQWFRSRHDVSGRAVFAVKRAAGRALSAASVSRAPVGDTGFAVSSTDIGMSGLCHHLLRRFNYGSIRETRRRNFMFLRDRLKDADGMVRHDLDEGVCPLFFPYLVADKGSAAAHMVSRGIEVIEFWNQGDPEAAKPGSAAQFLRNHLLEIPIHQDLSLGQLEFIAQQMNQLNIRSMKRAA